MKRVLRLCGGVLLALVVLAAVTEAVRRIRARWTLPDTDLVVLRYERVRQNPEGPGEVSARDFQEQLRDLYECGYRSVTPEQLRRHFARGEEIPGRPVLIVLATPSADLVAESEPQDPEERLLAPASIETVLCDLEFSAVVGIPSADALGETPDRRLSSPSGTPLLVWSEVRAAERRGVLSFAALDTGDGTGDAARSVFRRLSSGPRLLLSSAPAGSAALRAAAEAAGADRAIGSGDRVARVGARTDPFDVPSVAVVGGRHLFSVRVLRNAVDPTGFGELLVAHVDGPPMPLHVAVYDGRNADSPLLSAEIPALPHSETSSIALPAGIRFPLSVYLYDPTGSVFYHKREFTNRSVEKDPYYRPPVGQPDEEVTFDPL